MSTPSLTRELRRPIVLAAVSAVCLVVHYGLLRAMAHGHVAHALIANAAPPGAALLALMLVVVRFVSYMLVPGMALAAAAEVIAYVLVGPKRPEEL